METQAEKRSLLEKQLADDRLKASEIDVRLVTGYQGIYNTKIKRMIDIVLAVFICFTSIPIFFVVSVAIIVEDGFPVFYRAKRGGYDNRPFKIYKFRSMIKNADKVGGGTTALNDSRITKVGRVIRKMKIDEFPNLFNILKGEMSFIGPRPELLKYTNLYEGAETIIFKVRPGITDYSSIEFINLDEIVGSDHADERYEKYVLSKKNKLRVKYAATVSFTTDVKLFILTIGKVIKKCGCFCLQKDRV